MQDAMRRYRNGRVLLEPVRTIPLLIACDQRKLDGVVLGEANPALGRVRVIDSAALDLFVRDGPAFQKEYGEVPRSESLKLLGLLQLAEAINSQDRLVWRWAIQNLAPTPDPEVQVRALIPRRELVRLRMGPRTTLERQPGLELGRLLAEGLRDVQLVLWWKEEGKYTVIEPGLRCPDARSALYALALLRVSGGKGLGACLCCGKPLLVQRGMRRLYCSNKCKQAWHRKLKAQRQAKKRRKRR